MEELLLQFTEKLRLEEKSANTIAKYARDVKKFLEFASDENGEDVFLNTIDKGLCIQYKNKLSEDYEATSVNSMLVSLNRFLELMDMRECMVKGLKIQKAVYQLEEKNLTKEEYRKMVECALKREDYRLAYILETICATGIRIGELQHITVKSIKNGRAEVDCKGKIRTVFLPHKLKIKLRKYINDNQIHQGSVFQTTGGKPIDRSNLCKSMKKLAGFAGVLLSKVFPHNLRHLFAVSYYNVHRDIVKLADLLGHASVNTTRIYTMTSGVEHEQQINKLDLII
ncbi:MAG: tyrosine-type recombinase/integrase [Hespellia sp.]|nr:tyrosine-type recombinase/integrase [Hespellia sp.]